MVITAFCINFVSDNKLAKSVAFHLAIHLVVLISYRQVPMKLRAYIVLLQRTCTIDADVHDCQVETEVLSRQKPYTSLFSLCTQSFEALHFCVHMMCTCVCRIFATGMSRS